MRNIIEKRKRYKTLPSVIEATGRNIFSIVGLENNPHTPEDLADCVEDWLDNECKFSRVIVLEDTPSSKTITTKWDPPIDPYINGIYKIYMVCEKLRMKVPRPIYIGQNSGERNTSWHRMTHFFRELRGRQPERWHHSACIRHLAQMESLGIKERDIEYFTKLWPISGDFDSYGIPVEQVESELIRRAFIDESGENLRILQNRMI